MNDEKTLTPEEEKVIAKISGEEIEKATEILDSAEVNSTMAIDEEGETYQIIDNVGERLKEAHQKQHEENMSKVIENASEVLIEGTKEDKLGADMVRLARIDSEIQDNADRLEIIQNEVDGFIVAEGLDKQKAILDEQKKALKKDYDLLKTDLGKRTLAIYKATDNKKPALGCEIKMFKNREFSVDIKKAIQWCIDKDLKVFLDVDRGKYAEQLALGTFPDMPGSVDDSKIPKATISIKPYQTEKE